MLSLPRQVLAAVRYLLMRLSPSRIRVHLTEDRLSGLAPPGGGIYETGTPHNYYLPVYLEFGILANLETRSRSYTQTDRSWSHLRTCFDFAELTLRSTRMILTTCCFSSSANVLN